MALKLPITRTEKSHFGWRVETIMPVWQIITSRRAGGAMVSNANQYRNITWQKNDAGKVCGFALESDVDCKIIELIRAKLPRATRKAVEEQHGQAMLLVHKAIQPKKAAQAPTLLDVVSK